MSFSSLTVERFLDTLASAQPTPGGGTASAVAGAMGTALLVMVAGLPRTRANTDEERATLSEAREVLVGVRRALERCADRDTEAFNAVIAAYRLPKTGDEEKARRREAIARAMREATEAPLETLRLATAALELGETVARHGNPSAASDVRVAAGLLRAAGEGGAANVQINLEGLADETFRAAAAAEANELSTRTAAAVRRIHEGLKPGA